MTKENFFNKLVNVHGDKYGTDKVEYVNNKTKVILTCKEHGDFSIRPDAVLAGQGCPECAKIARANSLTKTQDWFILKSKEKWGDVYDISQSSYQGWNVKIPIICNRHGIFYKTPNHFLNGQGCPECAKQSRVILKSSNKEEFTKKGKELFGDKYDYNKVKYVNAKTPVCLVCPIHGEFWQTPDSHLHGSGCPHCGHTISKAEDEMTSYLSTIIPNTLIKNNDKTLLGNYEIDIYIPEYKIGIEFNGLHWHTEEFGKDRNYHLNKTLMAQNKGVHLIQIFEDEWIEHKDLIFDKLCHFFGKDSNKIKIGARKCLIKEISSTLAKPFLEKYHIQGFVGSSLYYGAYYNQELIGVMAFKEESKNMWNLTRFSSNINYAIPGLANKMFKQFTQDHSDLIEVKTFLDRRWSWTNINVYDRMGFTLNNFVRPDYRYVIGDKRIHKFAFRKERLNKKYGLPLTMTEKEMANELKIRRIWDCGLIKYVWRNKVSSIFNMGIGYRYVDGYFEIYCDATQIYNNQRKSEDDVSMINAALKVYGDEYKVVEYNGDYSGGTNKDDLPLRVRYLTNLQKSVIDSCSN